MTRQVEHILIQANTIKNFLKDNIDMPAWKARIFERRLTELENLTTLKDRRLAERLNGELKNEVTV